MAGTVNLADAELNISLASGYTPSETNTFILVDNDETDAITGTFSGLAEGAGGLVATVGFEGTGATYALQFRSSLIVGDWLTVATGANSPLIHTHSSAGTVGFYRILVE